MKYEAFIAIDRDEALIQLRAERREYRRGFESESEQRYNFAISALEALPVIRAVPKKDYDELLQKYEELRRGE